MREGAIEDYAHIRRTAAKGLAWSALQTYADRVISLLVLLVLARLLSPTAFGLVALATVFIAFAQIFVDQGFSDAIVQAPEIDRPLLDTAFWTNLVTSGLLLLLGLTMADGIAGFYHEPRIASIIRWLSLGFLFNALSSVQQALLRRRLDFKSLAIRSLTASVCSGVLAIVMALLGGGVWSLVVKVLSYHLIALVVLWGISDWRPTALFSKERFKKLYAFGVHIFGANFVDFFGRRSDDLLIGYFLGATMLGYYGIAYGLLVTLTEILIVVPTSVAFPALSRISQTTPYLEKLVYEGTQIISIITIPVFVVVAIAAPEVVPFLYGPQWGPSIPVVRVLMFVGICHSAFYFFGSLLKAVGKPAWRFALLSIYAVLNVVGFAIAVRWGITAVAIAYAGVGYLVAPLYLHFVRKATGIDIKTYFRQYVPAVLCSILTGIVVVLARYALRGLPGLLPRLAGIAVLGASSYLVFVYLVARPVFYRIIRLVVEAVPMASPILNRLLKSEG